MNEIIGTADCLNVDCKKPVPVKQQRNALAVMSCPWCGLMSQSFAAKGDRFLRSRMIAEINTAEAAAEAAPPTAKKETPPPPPPKAAEEPSIFDVFKKAKGAAHAKA